MKLASAYKTCFWLSQNTLRWAPCIVPLHGMTCNQFLKKKHPFFLFILLITDVALRHHTCCLILSKQLFIYSSLHGVCKLALQIVQAWPSRMQGPEMHVTYNKSPSASPPPSPFLIFALKCPFHGSWKTPNWVASKTSGIGRNMLRREKYSTYFRTTFIMTLL